MSNATFHNFTDEAFTGYWNGKGKKFEPGAKQYMPAWLAEHFAKHLTNRELIKAGKEVYTSPKKPADTPEFMKLFAKAFIPEPVREGANEVDDIIAEAALEPSSDIHPVPNKVIDDHSAAAALAKDPYEPTAHEVGPAGASTVIGEAADDEEDYQTDANSAEGA